jgi:hypothetical protein
MSQFDRYYPPACIAMTELLSNYQLLLLSRHTALHAVGARLPQDAPDSPVESRTGCARREAAEARWASVPECISRASTFVAGSVLDSRLQLRE